MLQFFVFNIKGSPVSICLSNFRLLSVPKCLSIWLLNELAFPFYAFFLEIKYLFQKSLSSKYRKLFLFRCNHYLLPPCTILSALNNKPRQTSFVPFLSVVSSFTYFSQTNNKTHLFSAPNDIYMRLNSVLPSPLPFFLHMRLRDALSNVR